jgi:predicted short-subunit dehydrogenase-like oxidoreductase (DUF2520 family)
VGLDGGFAAGAHQAARRRHPLHRRAGIGCRCRRQSCDFSRLLSRGDHGIVSNSADKYKMIFSL